MREQMIYKTAQHTLSIAKLTYVLTNERGSFTSPLALGNLAMGPTSVFMYVCIRQWLI